ncbi:hypothetical protein GOD78_10970 [Sinorhizobium medicae]|nr:hypothetical protein [Sinorhizobium medicae]MDX0818039.1 hypothetical protein [Sinorhizobium medicae]
MSELIPQTRRKTAAASAAEERVMRARAGHSNFTRSFADMAGNVVETGPRAAAAFVSGLGGMSNAPTVAAQKQAKKADVLDALPANAKALAKRYDDGTQKFVSLVYDRFAQTGEHLSFTASDAGVIMGKPTEAARKSVEALVTAGLLAPSYSSMGTLRGYLPGITN